MERKIDSEHSDLENGNATGKHTGQRMPPRSPSQPSHQLQQVARQHTTFPSHTNWPMFAQHSSLTHLCHFAMEMRKNGSVYTPHRVRIVHRPPHAASAAANGDERSCNDRNRSSPRATVPRSPFAGCTFALLSSLHHSCFAVP